ncbi:MAG TPA: 2-C-methyl-D-erythritol 4-phosphate cytidylyltransferase [Thioalkalivibrio sp.]|nr:2-C-methyl-D-erythritol 4-phosphate cytidylyltransferase [Thioalkalivibrio sp.]
MTDTRYWAVIPAAGVGKRMRADRPKQYLSLHGKTVLEHSIARFDSHPAIAGIVVAVSEDDGYWPDLAIRTRKPLHVAPGGKERSDSVINALAVLARHATEDDWVLVHDAARPCLRPSDIDRLIERLSADAVGGILATPVRDTMKRQDDAGRIQRTEEREGLWHALTPQMFPLGALRAALQRAAEEGAVITDEASALEYVGQSPLLVEGRGDNIKITRPEDLALAEFFLRQEAAEPNQEQA